MNIIGDDVCKFATNVFRMCTFRSGPPWQVRETRTYRPIASEMAMVTLAMRKRIENDGDELMKFIFLLFTE
jgi:hypothetical protein